MRSGGWPSFASHTEEEALSDAVEEAKREAAAGTHLLSMFGLAAGVRASLGHVSLRVPGEPDRFVVKGDAARRAVGSARASQVLGAP